MPSKVTDRPAPANNTPNPENEGQHEYNMSILSQRSPCNNVSDIENISTPEPVFETDADNNEKSFLKETRKSVN